MPLINEWIGSFTYVHNVGTLFYILTNYKASYCWLIWFDLYKFDMEQPIDEFIHDVIPEHGSNVLLGVEFVNGKLVA